MCLVELVALNEPRILYWGFLVRVSGVASCITFEKSAFFYQACITISLIRLVLHADNSLHLQVSSAAPAKIETKQPQAHKTRNILPSNK
jgi:hypothetical protein